MTDTPQLFDRPPDADAALVTRRKEVAALARDLDRKLAHVRRLKAGTVKAEGEARAIRARLEAWLRAEVPAAAEELLGGAPVTLPPSGITQPPTTGPGSF